MNNARSATNHCLHAIIRHPYQVILLTLLLAAFAFTFIVDVKTGKPLVELDPSVDSLLPTEDPDREYFERVKTIFDSGGTMLIALKDEQGIFTTANLEKISALSEELEGLDMVNRVSSLSTAMNIRSENNDLLIQPFYTDAPEDTAGLAELKQRALTDPIYAGNLVSTDAQVTVIVVHLLDVPEKELLDKKIDGQIMAVVGRHWQHGETWITGGAHIKAQMSEVMMRDVMTVVPLAMLVMAIISVLSFRSLRGIAIPVIVVSISVIITMAFIGVVYKTLNQVSIAVPSLVVVVGYSYAIHMLSGYYDALRLQTVPEGENPTLHVLKEVFAPVIYTGFTTAVGFFSLATSSLSAIQQFGISTGFGVCVTVIVTLVLAPAMLQVLPLPKTVRKVSDNTWLDQTFEKLARFDIRHAKAIYVINAVIAVICLTAFFKINVGTDLVSSFKESSDVRQDFNAVNNKLEGANAFEIVLETSVELGFQEPANLQAIEALQVWLKKQPEIGGSTSIVDYIKVINKGFTSEGDGYLIPSDQIVIGQLLEIAGNSELADYVSGDYQKARIVVRTTAIDSSDIAALIDRVEVYLGKNVPPHLSPRVTGNTYLVARTMDDIAIGQVWSVASAFIVIFFVLALIFTSFKAGFIAMLPNIMPVLIYFGILGYAGISLNVTTGLIACIVIGIAVDDTIHIFAQFNKLAKQNADVDTGIIMALKNVGRPVTYSTIALCAGFACLVFSEMRTQVEFGLLAAITLFFGWVSDVTLTPAIAGKMKIVTLWELLALNLGENPTQSIPFFKGLTQRQARITALMAHLQQYKQGQAVFHAGDAGDNMFVVIDGELTVSINGENGNVHHIKDIKRGDIIGEVALYHGARTANVTANTDVRLLEITRADLKSIQKQHPKIAAQLYANLNEVFAERFSKLTTRVVG